MVGRSLDAHNECNAPALMEETPKALRVAVVEDDPRIQQLISAEITDEGHACICFDWSLMLRDTTLMLLLTEPAG